MRGVCGVVAVGLAAMLVCCSADHQQEQEISPGEHSSANRYDANGHKTRNLDPLGGGHLIRNVRDTRPLSALLPYLMSRRYSTGGSTGGGELARIYDKRNFDEIDRSDLNPFIGKRNFDEIDRSDLNSFGKRNFDEIDHSSMPFSYAAKRFYQIYGKNSLDMPVEAWKSGLDKKRLRPEYPMDEIDLSYFPIGSKRSSRYNLDDDNSYQSSGADKKRRGADFPMDEIDASHFPVGSRRSLARR